MKNTQKVVAVVGAGWSGLSAAVRLTQAGFMVHLFDSAREPGGRARALDLMHDIKGDAEQGLKRLPLTLADSRGLRMRAARLPAPLHLLFALSFARGLSLGSRIAMVRLIETAKANHWRLDQDVSVSAWLEAERQPDELKRRIWLPLCVAALNTPATIASAQVFLNVLRDTLGAKRSASDLLLPMTSLDVALPYPAVEYLKQRGASIRLGSAVQTIRAEQQYCTLETRQGPEKFSGVVAAVPAHQIGGLFASESGPSWQHLRAQCEAFTWQPIATCYLVFDRPIHLPEPMMALAEDLPTEHYGQWVFARGRLGGRIDTLAVVISASGPHLDLPQRELALAIEKQLRSELSIDARLLGSRVITEKRATFAAIPGLSRPNGKTPSERIVLAGDYIDSDYPATLEAAVISGNSAAARLASHLNQPLNSGP